MTPKVKLKQRRPANGHRVLNRGETRTNDSTKNDFGNSPQRWKTKLEFYLKRAQELVAAGDSVAAENCFQHAEHLLRLIRDA